MGNAHKRIAGLEKDDSIHRFLSRLGSELGSDKYKLVDHWEADLCAIGIASIQDLRRLVYVCTYGQPAECFYFECEIADQDGGGSDYKVEKTGEGVEFLELLLVIKKHLGLK